MKENENLFVRIEYRVSQNNFFLEIRREIEELETEKYAKFTQHVVNFDVSCLLQLLNE